MKFQVCILLLLVYLIKSDIKYINPFIGTGGSGFGNGALNPGPQRPFAMVRLGPDTINNLNVFIRWDVFGGYHYNHSYIRVFSHVSKIRLKLDSSV